MPDFFPEGDQPAAQDDEKRSLCKIVSLLYESNGDKGPAYFPEGSRPLPGDDEERLTQKYNALVS